MPRSLLPKPPPHETELQRAARRLGISVVKKGAKVRFWYDGVVLVPKLRDWYEGGEMFTAKNSGEAEAFITGYWAAAHKR